MRRYALSQGLCMTQAQLEADIKFYAGKPDETEPNSIFKKGTLIAQTYP